MFGTKTDVPTIVGTQEDRELYLNCTGRQELVIEADMERLKDLSRKGASGRKRILK